MLRDVEQYAQQEKPHDLVSRTKNETHPPPRKIIDKRGRKLEHRSRRRQLVKELARDPETASKWEPRWHRYDLWNWD